MAHANTREDKNAGQAARETGRRNQMRDINSHKPQPTWGKAPCAQVRNCFSETLK
jgi:hypothetical protein